MSDELDISTWSEIDLNILLSRCFHKDRSKDPLSNRTYSNTLLPNDSQYAYLLKNNDDSLPQLSPREAPEYPILQIPENHLLKRYLNGLADIFNMPCAPELYYAQNHYVDGFFLPLSGAIIIRGDNNTNSFAVAQYLIAHEFAHGLNSKIYETANSTEKKKIEAFCDAFARVVRVEGFPENDQPTFISQSAHGYMLSLGMDDFIIDPQKGLDRTKANQITAILTQRHSTHPSYSERLLEGIAPPRANITEDMLELAQSVGKTAYSSLLLKYANEATERFGQEAKRY